MSKDLIIADLLAENLELKAEVARLTGILEQEFGEPEWLTGYPDCGFPPDMCECDAVEIFTSKISPQ